MVIDLKMVTRILRVFEAYYLERKAFVLDGSNYDLVLLVPAESTGPMKYSWIVSGRKIDTENETKIITELFELAKKNLSTEEYSSIARINILRSQNPLVKNINFTIPAVPEEVIQINNFPIGKIHLDNCILIRSMVLSRLKKGNAATITLNSGKKVNAGFISIDSKFKIKHYTGKGLRDLFNPEGFDKAKAKELESKGEKFLINNDYIGFTDFRDIRRID